MVRVCIRPVDVGDCSVRGHHIPCGDFEEPLRGESKSRFSIDSPFGLSTENEGNTLMAKPSTCFLDSLSRIPFGNPTTNALNNDPLRVLGEEWDNAGSENINCNKNCTNEIDDIPSSHTLLNMINDLRIRMDKLEEENIELRKKLSVENRHMALKMKKSEITINELLESNPIPSISLKDWVEVLLSQVPTHLEIVFNDSLLDGINSVFKSNSENLPIIAFKKKSNTFYYCDDIKGWILLETSEFDNIIDRISYRFLVAFNKEWYQPNIENIKHNEEYKNMYNSYYMKILGGTRMSDESRRNHVRNTFYRLIKQ